MSKYEKKIVSKTKIARFSTNNDIYGYAFLKKTRASEPLGNQMTVVQRKNIFACEVMLPKSLVHLCV